MLQNDDFTKDLFRFLQLLCEGHNNGKTSVLNYKINIMFLFIIIITTNKTFLVCTKSSNDPF